MIKNLTLAMLSSFALLACNNEQSAVESTETVTATTTETTTIVSPDFDSQMAQLARDYFALRPERATYFGVPDEKAGAGYSGRIWHRVR